MASRVSVSEAVPEGGANVPDVVHQVLPAAVPMDMRQEAGSVFPRSGAGSKTLNLSMRASPSWMFAVDCGESHVTTGGAFSVAHPPHIAARSAIKTENFPRWTMEERYFVDRGVDAWLKEDGAAPHCGG